MFFRRGEYNGIKTEERKNAMTEQKRIHTREMRGLSPEEVERSREAHGRNRLTERRTKGFFRRLLEGLSDPIIRVLFIAVLIEVIFTFRDCNWFEVGGILLAVFLSTTVSTVSECGSERAFAKLSAESRNALCRVIRGAEELMISAEELVVGDLVLLSAGETVRADGVILFGELSLDLSALNGESKESARSAGEFSGTWSLSDPHQVFSGSMVASGNAAIQVRRVGDETMYGALARDLQTETRESPLKLRLGRLARDISRIGYIAAILVSLCYLLRIFVFDAGFSGSGILSRLADPVFVFHSLLKALTLAITVIVVAVPEGLPMMITVVLSSNMKRMMRDQVLVKKLVGIETAGSMNLLFTDKTGTLTTGQMTLSHLLLGDGSDLKLSACKRDAPEVYRLLSVNAHYNTESSILGGKPVGGNATERALLAAFSDKPPEKGWRRGAFLPFRSDRKLSAASLTIAGKSLALYKGAPEYLLPKATRYIDRFGNSAPLDGDRFAALDRAWRAAAARGERIIAVLAADAYESRYADMRGLTLVALLALGDRVRRDVRSTVRTMQKAGIRVVMLTGDNRETAAAIAEECGLYAPETANKIIESKDLAALSDDEVREMLPHISVIARAIPSDKTRLVRIAQESGLVVGMTGDGINDAPALKLADVGFAMGSGTDIAREAGDIVLLDNSISSVASAVLYGRTIFSSIRKFITFQLMMNLCAVGISLFGQFIGIENPITIIQMLWVNLIMDTLGGLAFAGEPPLPSQMREPPKRREEAILNRYMIHQIVFTGGFTLLLCMLFLRAPLFRTLFCYEEDPAVYLTAFFALFIFAGLANCFNARTERLWLLANIKRNRPFILILLGITAVQLFMIYRGGGLFRTVPLEPRVLLAVLGLAALVIPADFIRKCFCRLSGKNDRF
jgi:calcium-translocating P-type ATPase